MRCITGVEGSGEISAEFCFFLLGQTNFEFSKHRVEKDFKEKPQNVHHRRKFFLKLLV